MKREGRARLLLHVCCAPCATAPIERVSPQYDLALFFSNSNVWPKAEYEKRLNEARRLAGLVRLPLAVDPYDHVAWQRSVRGWEREPEGGERCRHCFAFSLGRTARHAERNGFDFFSTTLTVSPHKSSRLVFEAGASFPSFLPLDFKKQGGFQQSVTLSATYHLYRQDYCGCEFSYDARERKKGHGGQQEGDNA